MGKKRATCRATITMILIHNSAAFCVSGSQVDGNKKKKK